MATQDSTTLPAEQRVIDLQIELEELQGLCRLIGESVGGALSDCDVDDIAGVFVIVGRRIDVIREGMNDLLPTAAGGAA